MDFPPYLPAAQLRKEIPLKGVSVKPDTLHCVLHDLAPGFGEAQ
jgi:hypothetical protein